MVTTDRKTHRLQVARFLEYSTGQQLYLELKEKFRKRVNYTLIMRYATRLSRELEGFYLSSYTNKDGERRSAIKNTYLVSYNNGDTLKLCAQTMYLQVE